MPEGDESGDPELGRAWSEALETFDRATRVFDVVKRHHAVLQTVAGIVLIGMGVLVLTNELFRLNAEAQRLLSELGLDFFYNL